MLTLMKRELTPEENKEISNQLEKFREAFPNTTSSDLQTFTLSYGLALEAQDFKPTKNEDGSLNLPDFNQRVLVKTKNALDEPIVYVATLQIDEDRQKSFIENLYWDIEGIGDDFFESIEGWKLIKL